MRWEDVDDPSVTLVHVSMECDTDGDGAVDVRDYVFLKETYGWASADLEVPEPATLGLLSTGAAAILFRRRRAGRRAG